LLGTPNPTERVGVVRAYGSVLQHNRQLYASRTEISLMSMPTGRLILVYTTFPSGNGFHQEEFDPGLPVPSAATVRLLHLSNGNHFDLLRRTSNRGSTLRGFLTTAFAALGCPRYSVAAFCFLRRLACSPHIILVILVNRQSLLPVDQWPHWQAPQARNVH